jgi:hypothetical protein
VSKKGDGSSIEKGKDGMAVEREHLMLTKRLKKTVKGMKKSCLSDGEENAQ